MAPSRRRCRLSRRPVRPHRGTRSRARCRSSRRLSCAASSAGDSAGAPPKPPPPRPALAAGGLRMRSATNCTPLARLPSMRGLDGGPGIRDFERVRRENRLNDDVCVAVGEHRLVVGRQATGRRPCRASRSRAAPSCESAASGDFSSSRTSAASSGAETFERPDRVNARELIGRGARHRLERRHDRSCPGGARGAAAPCRATSRSDG